MSNYCSIVFREYIKEKNTKQIRFPAGNYQEMLFPHKFIFYFSDKGHIVWCARFVLTFVSVKTVLSVVSL